MGKDYAKGIKRKEWPGDEKKLKPGMLVDYFVQHHNAKRRGPHFDFRLGTPETNLFSWASTPHPLKQHEGARIPIARTNLHRFSYGNWEGMIPPGYGHGMVKKDSSGKALITRTTDKTISFSLGEGKYPQRFTLVNPGSKYGKGYWMMLRQKTPEDSGVTKTHYKSVAKADIEKMIKELPADSVIQPKLDGALQFITLGKNKIEAVSHRISEVNDKPIHHTERIFGLRPHVNIPKNLRGTVLLAEIYGAKDGTPIEQQQTSGLLNSSLAKSLEDQKANGIKLNGMVFGLAKHKGKNVNFDMPYDERKAIIMEALKLLPAGQFHYPDEAVGPKAGLALWKKIKQKEHDSTNEGVVVHPRVGVPTKIKHLPEQDVHIRGFFPGEGKYKDKGVGGFQYSHKQNGKIVGKVGTGLSDDMRKAMLEDPKAYIGRIARVHSQGQLPSGALRAPALINIHHDS